VGDDPGASSGGTPGAGADAGSEATSSSSSSSSSGSPSDGGVPPIAPDAAPPLGCPAQCLPSAPAGWKGPSAVYDGAPATKPAACPALYSEKLVDGAHQALANIPAASCGCGAAEFTGAKCSIAVAYYPSNNCSDALPVGDFMSIPGKTCSATAGVYQSFKIDGPATLTRGTCAFPFPTKTVTPPTFDKVNVACALPQDVACADRVGCVATPTPDPPFTRLCIHRDGDESCPSLDYAVRFVTHKSIVEGRTCTGCTGTTSQGTCGTTFDLSSTANCSVATGPADLTLGVCRAITSSHINVADIAASGIVCSPAAGSATAGGTVTSAEPVTFCCNK